MRTSPVETGPMTPLLLMLFLAVVTGGILGIGVLFNAITHWFI